MKQEDKILLAKDLFSRALSGVKVDYRGEVYTLGYNLYLKEGDIAFESYPMQCFLDNVESVKPYLRPMSSMTEEEKEELLGVIAKETDVVMEQLKTGNYGIREGKYHFNFAPELNWLIANHFDYNGLIPKGLAIEVTEENNPYK